MSSRAAPAAAAVWPRAPAASRRRLGAPPLRSSRHLCACSRLATRPAARRRRLGAPSLRLYRHLRLRVRHRPRAREPAGCLSISQGAVDTMLTRRIVRRRPSCRAYLVLQKHLARSGNASRRRVEHLTPAARARPPRHTSDRTLPTPQRGLRRVPVNLAGSCQNRADPVSHAGHLLRQAATATAPRDRRRCLYWRTCCFQRFRSCTLDGRERSSRAGRAGRAGHLPAIPPCCCPD